MLSPCVPNSAVLLPNQPHSCNSKQSRLPSILYFNARSIFPKRSELTHICQQIQPLILAISETWLDSNISDGSFLPAGYITACRTDRVGRRGGGVLIACQDQLSFKERRDLCHWEESSWVEVQLHSSCPLLVGCYYRPPLGTTQVVNCFTSSLETTFARINLASTNVIIVGDFNATHSSWCTLDTTTSTGRLLHQTFLTLGLHQFNSSRTHLDSNGRLTSLLDLLLVSKTQLVHSATTLPPIANCDHLPILCKLSRSLKSFQSNRTRRIWCYAKADPGKLNDELRHSDWMPVSKAENVHAAWEAWKTIFTSVVCKHVPSKLIKQIKPKLPWMTPLLEKEIRTKRALFRQSKRSCLIVDREAFNQQRNKVTNLMRKAERAYVLTLHRGKQSSCVNNLYSFFRSLSGKSYRVPIPELRVQDTTLSTSLEKAEALNAFFISQTTSADKDAIPDTEQLPKNSAKVSYLSATAKEVLDVLTSLPRRKSPGLDGITTDLLKLCAPGAAASLAVLFNRSFSDGVYPSAWKDSLVVPVFKRGDRAALTNYRPIALLSSVSKVCERVVHNKLYPFLTPYLSDMQSGFKKRDSTTYQLTRLVQQWSESLDASKYVGVIFFDLQKAFDKVWHKGLLAKLSSAGVSDSALEWFKSYLSNRRQQTRVADAISCPDYLLAGVPQGAILSPLLFALYVNDIVKCAEDSEINLFADDTSLYIEDYSASSLSTRLQECVNILSAWFNKWLLSVNPQKTALLVLRTSHMQPLHLSININGTEIPQVVRHKHLGVTFDDRLTWKDHIDTISTTAARKIGFLRRYRKRLPPIVLQHLYKQSIRPTLEYASVAWSGVSVTEKLHLERIQRRAARLITGESPRSDTPHDILLARAGLPTLSSQREVEQIVFAFKFLQNLLPNASPYCPKLSVCWCTTEQG